MTYISYGANVDESYLVQLVYVEELDAWWSFTATKFKQLLADLLANWGKKDRVEYSHYGRRLKRPSNVVQFDWDGSRFVKHDRAIIYGMLSDSSKAEVIDDAVFFWGIDPIKVMRKATNPEEKEPYITAILTKGDIQCLYMLGQLPDYASPYRKPYEKTRKDGAFAGFLEDWLALAYQRLNKRDDPNSTEWIECLENLPIYKKSRSYDTTVAALVAMHQDDQALIAKIVERFDIKIDDESFIKATAAIDDAFQELAKAKGYAGYIATFQDIVPHLFQTHAQATEAVVNSLAAKYNQSLPPEKPKIVLDPALHQAFIEWKQAHNLSSDEEAIAQMIRVFIMGEDPELNKANSAVMGKSDEQVTGDELSQLREQVERLKRLATEAH